MRHLPRAAFAGASFVMIVLRLEPQLFSDPGVFLTMFDGVLDGDRLYKDRWDHKDLGFYWLGAASVAVFGTYGPAVLDALVLLGIGNAALAWAKMRGCSGRAAAIVGIAAMGFVTNPAFHATGLTEPPALLAILAAYVAIEKRKVRLALALVGVVAVVKLGFVLLCVPLFVMARVRLRSEPRVALVALIAPTVAGLILLVRGELSGWYDSVLFNRSYANVDGSYFGSQGSGFGFHVDRIVTVVTGSPSLLATVVFLVVGWVSTFDRKGGVRRTLVGEVPAALLVLTVTLVLTFVTGHMMRAAVVALVLALAVTFGRVRDRFGMRVAYVALVICGVVASGPHPSDIEAIGTVRDRWGSVRTDIAPTMQAALDSAAPSGTIHLAVSLGPPSEAFLPFLDDRIRLSCPDHHLLPWFAERLDGHLRCIAERASHMIVGPVSTASAEMVEYGASLDALRAAEFELVAQVSPQVGPVMQIFERRGAVPANS